MMIFFCLLALILLLQSIAALVAGLRFARYALRAPALPVDRYRPKAVIIVPCKGLEPDFEHNIGAFFAQDYRDYELIFVTESEADPAHAVLTQLIRESHPAWLVVAGEAQDCGQKVHNLRAAIEMLDTVDRRAEVIVFADSDARPAANWLTDLISPLGDKKVGATTGFRWYLPVRGRLWSALLSAWNASAVTLLGERSSFAWGGATAIRRETFEKLRIKDRWQGALSDDYVLTHVVKSAGGRIKFAPSCLVATHADASFGELLEFTTRQMTITRIYAPRVWCLAFFTHFFFNFTFWGGLALLAVEGVTGDLNDTLLSLLVSIFLLGAMGGWLRAVVATQLLGAERKPLPKYQWAHLLLWPLVSLLYLYNTLASALTRRIVWRGISYKMISPHQTLILHRPPQPAATDAATTLSGSRRASVRSSS
jgi:cellulose synthase/poly-beta-1,6-N-acetylglucosamine synthase-like glycosyltransferase